MLRLAPPLLFSIKSRKDYRPPDLLGLTYDGGPALFLKLCPNLILKLFFLSTRSNNHSKPKNEILDTRGGNLITHLKLTTHHQSRFRDQKVHTTSIYLFDQNCQLDGSTKYIAGHCTLICWVTQIEVRVAWFCYVNAHIQDCKTCLIGTLE